MADIKSTDSPAEVLSADELRMKLLTSQMEALDRREKANANELQKLAEFANSFLHDDVSEQERAMIRRLVENAVKDGKFEALVYSFPSSLCTDDGRAINNAQPNWPETLQGKAKILYDRYKAVAQPKGYRLKAMIISFPGGMPGDVGLFLTWAPE
jgi:hypothetical protein